MQLLGPGSIRFPNASLLASRPDRAPSGEHLSVLARRGIELTLERERESTEVPEPVVDGDFRNLEVCMLVGHQSASYRMQATSSDVRDGSESVLALKKQFEPTNTDVRILGNVRDSDRFAQPMLNVLTGTR